MLVIAWRSSPLNPLDGIHGLFSFHRFFPLSYLTRVPALFLSVSTIVSTIIGFQTAFDSMPETSSKTVFLCSFYSILANQLLQFVGGLQLHILVAVAVNVQGEGKCCMAQGFGECLGIDMALQGQRGIGVP